MIDIKFVVCMSQKCVHRDIRVKPDPVTKGFTLYTR